MKKVVIVIAILASITSQAQTNLFCLQPSCPQNIQLPIKSDTIFAQLSASDGTKSIIWSQVSGPNQAVFGIPILTANGTQQLLSALPLSNLITGTYVFKAIATSTGGTVGSSTTTVVVLAAPPPPPTPRTVISFSFKLVNGVWTPAFVFSDGSVQ